VCPKNARPQSSKTLRKNRYNHRSRGEAQIGRWKKVIGPKLKAWNFPNKKTEVRIGTNILNKMNGIGSAKYEAVA
jgi:hypothetical protein